MGSLVRFKRKISDRTFTKNLKIFENGLIREERSLLPPMVRPLFTKEMGMFVMLLSSIYRLPNLARTSKGIAAVKNQVTGYAANMDIILSYIELSHRAKGINGINLSLLYKKAYRLAALYYPDKAEVFEEKLLNIYEGEEKFNRDPDIMAGYFGNIFEEIFSFKEDKYLSDLREVGYYFGKYTYLSTKYDNLRADEKKGYYNPLIFVKKQDPIVFDTYMRQTIRSQGDACIKAFDRLPVRDYNDIFKCLI